MIQSSEQIRFALYIAWGVRLVGGIVFTVIVGVCYVWVYDSLEDMPDTTDAVWMDTTLDTEARVADLLAHMTLREKIGQMALVEKNSVVPQADIATYGLGGLLSGAGAKPSTNTSAGWSDMIDSFQASARTSRLGIPLLYGADAVHGHALVPGATVFPHQLGLGATGDADLVEAIARATALDLQATGVNWNYAPNLDLPQDIRWGRMYEAFSDDPILTSRLGAAYVRGVQATSSEGVHTLVSLKHYIGLGGMQWDTSSNKNFKIDQGVTPADEVALRSAYLKPFQAGVDAGAASVMIGLNGWGDSKLVNQTYLITDVLKGELGFSGFAVSDWYGIYEGNGNRFLATVRGINAGIDMVMLPFSYKTFVRDMVIANRLHLISTARIDDAVSRILRSKFQAGLFDATPAVKMGQVRFSDHEALARAAVAQSLVLLKNEAATLPITPAVQSLRVAGSAADNVGQQSGAWTVEWQGVAGNWLPHGTSILAGITKRAPESMRIEYSASGSFAGTMKADLGIAVVGETPYAEGWGDRAYPILSEFDLQAIKNLQASCKKVVVIMVSGRPLLIANEVDGWDALVMAFLPGTAGAGIADVLFGDRNFMGTLPVPWPRTSEQLPLSLSGAAADGTPVLFPRYSGLSY